MQYGLASAVHVAAPAQDKAIVPTDLAVAVPYGTYGRIAPKSDLSAKQRLAVGAGVNDPDFRGNAKSVSFNHGNVDFYVTECGCIAQLQLERIESPPIVVVTQLPKTNCGFKGFESTGTAVIEVGGRAVVTLPVISYVPNPKDQQSQVPPVAVI